jgi:hypothetical protein
MPSRGTNNILSSNTVKIDFLLGHAKIDKSARFE